MTESERLRSQLDYDPDTGVFTWKVSNNRIVKVGQRAGGIAGPGYRMISVNGNRHWEHRLAWLYVHGEWPAECIDHVNGIKTDNRIANLRLASPGENAQNVQAARSDSKSGLRGVWQVRSGKWVCQIKLGGSAGARLSGSG